MIIKIGLEIHCQLTEIQSKLFCSCFSNYRTRDVNENICPVCVGLPGTLPLLNRNALNHAIMISKTLNCEIPEMLMFSRKNYFYPDLPKNFQITQYDTDETNTCIGKRGAVYYGDGKKVRILRIQLEEDPGRIVYEESTKQALIDYNRSGVALVEIVTAPDFDDPKDVRLFLNKITSILAHLNVCRTDLEGSIRCDANISIREGKKVEIKNVSSFKDVEKALTYEIARQQTMNVHDIEIKAETRHWDEKRKITKQSRSKEEVEDYRYFPEPDIPKILVDQKYISSLKIPELPDDRKLRFISQFGLSEHVSQVLIDNKELGDLFESAVKIYYSPVSISNWIVSDILAFLDFDSSGKKTLEEMKINANHIVEVARLVDENVINRTVAKSILSRIIKTGELPSKIINEKQVSLITDEKLLSTTICSVFDKEKNAVEDAKRNPTVINYLLGKVMRETSGRADAKITLRLIRKNLEEGGG